MQQSRSSVAAILGPGDHIWQHKLTQDGPVDHIWQHKLTQDGPGDHIWDDSTNGTVLP